MEAVGSLASIIAVVELSAKIASLCFEYSKNVKNARKDINRLSREINNLKTTSVDVKELLDGPNSKGLKSSRKLQSAVEDSLVKLQKLEQKLEKKLDPRVRRKAISRFRVRALKWPFSSKEVEKTVQDLAHCTYSISLALQVDQTTIIFNVDSRAVLDQLAVAEGASFNSRAEEHNPTCLPNTRVELLEQISQWVDDPRGKTIFWLNGMAGTGKSTISRTFAHKQSEIGRLGASFFFKRGEPDRGNLSKFMTTIARQLVEREPSLIPVIKEVLEADPALTRSAAQEQFTRLIFEPLLKIDRAVPIVVIVDALDECDNDKDIRLLINLFSRAQPSQPCRLRVVLTSRPELPVRLGFNDAKNAYQDLILHEMPSPMIEHDISAFLKHELGRIRDDYNASIEEEWKLPSEWPVPSKMKALVKMAIPLFIFAATACRFISERRCGDPDTQLKRILEYGGTSANSELDATYMPILDQQIVGLSQQDREDVIRQFRQIIGTIIILESPLSIPALSQLLGVLQGIIKRRLDQLHSVLSIPASTKSPVRLLHLSFRDFLVDPANHDKTPLWIDEKQMHRHMVEQCLRIMGERLRSDMCDIRWPGTLRTLIDRQKIETCLPPELQYCCLYWVYHLQRAEVHASDSKDVYNFLTGHLLHWLEALSLMGRASEGLRLIKTLQMTLNFDQSGELLAFLEDIIRFILTNISVIDSTPLQIYSSLLLFSPEQSKMRAIFRSTMARWVSVQVDLDIDWGPCLQTLEGHSGPVWSATFSHNSALLASASDDKTIRVWRPDTGECIQTLKGHSGSVTLVTFSHDSALLASASDDKMIRIWRPDMGECIQTLKGHSELVTSITFSYDLALFISASYKTIRVWRPDTGECIQTLKGYSGWVMSVTFSYDSALLALASEEEKIWVWRPDTGECIQTLGDHKDSVTSITFSHDSALVASASEDKTIRVWRPDTGECIQTLKGHKDSVTSVTFSHDSAMLASASEDKTIRVWRPVTGEYVQTLKGHSGSVTSVTFSHDSALLASVSEDETIRVWRPDMGEYIQTLKGHSGSVTSVTFSHDSALLASVSEDETIRVWRPDIDECIQTLKGHSGLVTSVTFSHDAAILASTSYKTIWVWRLDTGECIQTLKGHSGLVTSVTFSHDSALLALASHKRIWVWRLDTGECIQTLKDHNGLVTSVTFSHDSALLALASHKRIWIWRPDTGECIQTLKGHSGWVRSVAFSHDSVLLASASEDKTIRVWRPDTGECIQNIQIGVISWRLSFQPGDQEVLTDVGVLAIYGTNHTSSTIRPSPDTSGYRSGCGISTDLCWITWNGENLLWLPKEFRAECFAISRSTVAIGCDSGKVLLVTLVMDELLAVTKVT